LRAHRTLFALGAAVAFFSPGSPPANAATTTNTFAATISIQSSCQVVSTNMLDFGVTTALVANHDAQTNFAVQCTNATAFHVGLDAGSSAGGSVATRLMTSGGGAVGYQLYSNAARTTNWGNTVGTDTVSGAGSGSALNLTVYGRVAPQSTPAPGTYSDTVTVTVTY
jgi:spore coat protein U-like protein